jgi:CRISPR-associated protein Csd2
MSVNRHDILIFLDVQNGNPNGNPDAGNMPRIEPNTGKGLISDVCLKRKVRNFVAQYPPPANGNDREFGIIVQQGVIINSIIRGAEDKHSQGLKELPKGTKPAQKKAAEDAASKETVGYLCRKYYDIRTFGMVLGTGEKGDLLTGSPHGQVRGPVQFTFGTSLDPIPTQEITITRCAVTKEEDAAKERTMGNKHIVPYGLYAAKAFISPIFAERTGFDETDLAVFFDALKHLFSNDQSAARAEMNVRAIFDFEHVGTQTGRSAEQNKREAMLGCAHAHKLFEQVISKRKTDSNGRTFPASFADYELREGEGLKRSGDGILEKFPGVKLNRIL